MTELAQIIFGAVGFFLVVFAWGISNVFGRRAKAIESAPPPPPPEPTGPDPTHIAELEADCAVPMEDVIREAEMRAVLDSMGRPAADITTDELTAAWSADRVRAGDPAYVHPRLSRAVNVAMAPVPLCCRCADPLVIEDRVLSSPVTIYLCGRCGNRVRPTQEVWSMGEIDYPEVEN